VERLQRLKGGAQDFGFNRNTAEVCISRGHGEKMRSLDVGVLPLAEGKETMTIGANEGAEYIQRGGWRNFQLLLQALEYLVNQ
jgi:hypothetical protein